MKTVFCLGDSNTYGYDPRSYLGGRYPAQERWPEILARQTGLQVINGGSNGLCIPAAAPAPEADLLIVMLGTNDLLQGASPQAAALKMEKFLLGVQLPTLLVAPPPLQPGLWVEDESLIPASRRLAALYRELAGRLGIPFLDAGSWGIPLAFDGVHFTPQGHQAFARGLIQEFFV